MNLKKGKIIELVIGDLAFGGKGISKVDGFTVFVDQTAPGDVVLAKVVKKKKNFAEARVTEIISPSPLRIKAPCRYSGYCGGCKWQFLPYGTQLEYKRKHVTETLAHIAFLKDIPIHPTLPSPRIFGYRNKMEFSCSDRRWLLPEEMGLDDIDTGFALGLHVPGTFYKVLDIKSCLLPPEEANMIMEDVRKFIKNSSAPVYGIRSHKGFWRFLMLRQSVARNQWLINIITAYEDRKTLLPLAELLMQKYPRIVSVINNITSRKAGIAVGEYEILLLGEPFLIESIGPYEFEISANSFFQTNTLAAEKLYETVANYARLSGSETVIDLYSGTGAIAICLAHQAREVIGLEIVDSAVSDAEKNCRINDVSNCRFVPGDIRNSLSQLDVKPNVMIIDPPRDGMHKDVVRKVLEMVPERIVYVSCNPSTLARDLAMLKEVYKVCEVQTVDMFPHTFHIECVARLEKSAP